MATTYHEADQTVYATMNRVLAKRFPDVHNAEVRIQILMATAPKGKPAVKLHGAACNAKIAVVKGHERATGGPDERIFVDATKYADMRAKRRESLFAHELMHIIVERDEDGKVVKDDYDRPATRHQPDDWIMTGFKQVADWYGPDSGEHQSYNTLGQILGQQTMPFMRADEPGEDMQDADADDSDEAAPSLAGSTARREASA